MGWLFSGFNTMLLFDFVLQGYWFNKKLSIKHQTSEFTIFNRIIMHDNGTILNHRV